MKSISIFGVQNMPEIFPGDHLAHLIIKALKGQEEKLLDGDIVIVTSKIVSKAEGCMVNKDEVIPSPFAVQLAESINRDPRLIEIVLRESVRTVKVSDQVLITETKHGFICANAGVDQSNVKEEGECLLLPKDPDHSALKIRSLLQSYYKVNLTVIISDTFGRPWRLGQTNIAIGVSGMLTQKNYSGKLDRFGRKLKSTSIAIADEIAGAAELVMGKTRGIPVSVLRGYPFPKGEGEAKDLLRSTNKDLFR